MFSVWLNSERVRLQNEVYDLQQEIFQMSNFNTTIIIKNDESFLEPSVYAYSDDIVTHITLYGDLIIDLTIVTPHYGKVMINLKEFI